MYQTPAEAAYRVPLAVMAQGTPVRPRGLDTHEMLFVQFSVQLPENIPFALKGRSLNPRYAAIEILTLLGCQSADSQQRYNAPGLARYQDENIQYGNYGLRIRSQLMEVVALLSERDPFSRQAVLSIYDGSRDLHVETFDTPCTLTIQFLYRDALHMHVSMRSSDVYLGLPYDLHQFCALQATIAYTLNAACGLYTHTSGSCHLYDRDAEAIKHVEAPPEQERELDELWCVPDELKLPIERMAYITAWCQDVLSGRAVEMNTPFEHWLVVNAGT